MADIKVQMQNWLIFVQFIFKINKNVFHIHYFSESLVNQLFFSDRQHLILCIV